MSLLVLTDDGIHRHLVLIIITAVLLYKII